MLRFLVVLTVLFGLLFFAITTFLGFLGRIFRKPVHGKKENAFKARKDTDILYDNGITRVLRGEADKNKKNGKKL